MKTMVLLMAILAVAASAKSVGDTVTLWRGGDGGVKVYRIPALCTAPNGDLVAVCDARYQGMSDLYAGEKINISCRRSSDNGKTWTKPVETWTWKYDDEERWAGSDPSFIVDREAKKIFLFYNVWESKKRHGVFQFYVQESSDNGRTWSKPRDISKDISFPGWPFGAHYRKGNGFIFISSGSGIQLKDGTLLHTLVHVRDGNALFGSTDHGRTWKAMGKPVKEGDECKVVELSDGRWMINSRWRRGQTPGRMIHVSADRGKTWTSRYDTSLADPQCNAQIMRYGKALLFSNCKSNRRENLHLRTSVDEGETWNDGVPICSGGSAYSDITELKNGDVGCLYEGAGYQTIDFTTIPRDICQGTR